MVDYHVEPGDHPQYIHVNFPPVSRRKPLHLPSQSLYVSTLHPSRRATFPSFAHPTSPNERRRLSSDKCLHQSRPFPHASSPASTCILVSWQREWRGLKTIVWVTGGGLECWISRFRPCPLRRILIVGLCLANGRRGYLAWGIHSTRVEWGGNGWRAGSA
jgi:hypothetical protein